MLPALSLLPSSSTSSSSKLSSMRPFQTPASKHLLLRTNKSPDFQSNQLQTAKANHLETTSPLPLITISTAIKAPLSIQLRSAYYRQHSFTVWSYNSHQSLFSCCITGALKVLQILDSCPMPKRFWSDGCSGISRPMGFFNMCLVCIWCTPSPQRSPLPLSGFRSGSSVQLTGGSASQPARRRWSYRLSETLPAVTAFAPAKFCIQMSWIQYKDTLLPWLPKYRKAFRVPHNQLSMPN